MDPYSHIDDICETAAKDYLKLNQITQMENVFFFLSIYLSFPVFAKGDFDWMMIDRSSWPGEIWPPCATVVIDRLSSGEGVTSGS